MPIANDKIGGAVDGVENNEQARSIVPSPPNVAIRSVFAGTCGSSWKRSDPGSEAWCVGAHSVSGSLSFSSLATFGSAIREMSGYSEVICLCLSAV